ncbi:hypothetical protein E2C01_096280 [Portunus trituberculatus]|uniref:Uncharacterized protein n=1 Tax=Portunus trituberculatus TaxID=210409 RepID=A0A5B7JV77_PORTR|nr:hypothetical protein [Portunus trituberculatus]
MGSRMQFSVYFNMSLVTHSFGSIICVFPRDMCHLPEPSSLSLSQVRISFGRALSPPALVRSWSTSSSPAYCIGWSLSSPLVSLAFCCAGARTTAS